MNKTFNRILNNLQDAFNEPTNIHSMGRLIGLKRSDFQKDSHVILNRTLILDNILNDSVDNILSKTLIQWDFCP